MAFDREHVLITTHGTLGNPIAEDWSFGIRCGFESVMTQADLQAAVDELADGAAGFVRTNATEPLKVTHVKMAKIGVNGLYPDGWNSVEHTFTPPQGPGGSPVLVPMQIALAVTWTTGISRGKAHEGRSFLPQPMFQPQSDGRIFATDAADVASTAINFLNAILAVTAVDLRPRVFSQGTPTSPTPVSNTITGVRVGRVLDTIRSRRRNLVEDYQVATL